MSTEPMWADPTEPRTKAGRRLIASFPANCADCERPEFIRHVAQSILAIEGEAAASRPISTEPEGLREAVQRWLDYTERNAGGTNALDDDERALMSKVRAALATQSRGLDELHKSVEYAMTVSSDPFTRRENVHAAIDLWAATQAPETEGCPDCRPYAPCARHDQ